ncbi:hypothetical protein K3740_02790 [Ruegeria conchae]|uniref:hypothetical protein n=1 Tax=Ruegeria conchae TaxID=981384 RepID=UPI0021A82477|nr:hypothetical protein [Ruegeria conchae]UWR03648.1 hypothetical protein K3740_02790 [Ruegeria conchae]
MQIRRRSRLFLLICHVANADEAVLQEKTVSDALHAIIQKTSDEERRFGAVLNSAYLNKPNIADGNRRPDGPKASYALTIKLDH